MTRPSISHPTTGPILSRSLVHNVPWTLQSVGHTPVQTEILCSLDFTPGSRRYELFPITHTIFIRVTIREGAVSWKYTVQNRSAEHRLHSGSACTLGFSTRRWTSPDASDRSRHALDGIRADAALGRLIRWRRPSLMPGRSAPSKVLSSTMYTTAWPPTNPPSSSSSERPGSAGFHKSGIQTSGGLYTG